MLALPPERRITAQDALGSGWLQLEGEEQEELETEGDSAGPALPEVPAPSGAGVANGDSLADKINEMSDNSSAKVLGMCGRMSVRVLFPRSRLQMGFLRTGKDPVDQVGHSCL